MTVDLTPDEIEFILNAIATDWGERVFDSTDHSIASSIYSKFYSTWKLAPATPHP